MKTQISKLFFVFGATLVYFGLFSPLSAQAQQTTFNTMSNDRPVIQVSNYTNNPGCSSCWSNSVSADPGDIVSVYIYYHNTGTATANNTKLKINANQNTDASSHVIYGSVSASNANTVSGNANINISGNESLVFDNYVRWYPNHDGINSDPIPFGQNGNEVLGSGGLNIGNIAPDSPLGSFSTQGSLVVRFRITNTQTPPPPQPQNNDCKINFFDANPKSINYGESTDLDWDTTNCDYVKITGGGLNLNYLNKDGTKHVGPLTNDTTYTLTAYGSYGSVFENETVYVYGYGADECSIDYFYADPDQIDEGDGTTLYWATTGCDDVDISNGIGDVSNDGSKYTYSLYKDTTYVMTATGDNGSDSKTIKVWVSEDSGSDNCEIDYFYADPDEIDEGEDTTLYWATSNCDDVDISNGVGDVNEDGHEDINNLYEDETYTITATGNNSSDSKTITVEVDEDNGNNDDECEIDEFYADPDEIDEGERTTLYWETTNCDDVEINNGIGDVSRDGDEETEKLYDDETFKITASNDDSSDSKTITVRVDEDNNDDECEIDEFYASPTNISYGDSVRIYWKTTNCDDVYINNGVGDVSNDGNERVENIYSTKTFTITAHGDEGSDNDSLTVYVDENPVYSTTAVTTLGVQNVTKTSADLAGVLVNTGGSVNVWFEWGTATSLGNSTSKLTYSGNLNTTFTKKLTGLNQDTLYYFKAVASGSNGTVEGAIRYFRTSGATNPVNNIVYVNSGTGESLVDLDIASAFENVSNGESFDINIDYVNTSSSVVAKDTVLTIVLPQNLIFERISRGEYNKTDHTVFADLEDIDPKEEGEIILKVKVGSKAQDGELLVTVGTLNYEKSNNKKEEVIDILTNKVSSDGSVLGAFALGGGFLPNTLVGWLLLLTIFMVIVYIANRMIRRKNNIAQPMAVPVPPQTYR